MFFFNISPQVERLATKRALHLILWDNANRLLLMPGRNTVKSSEKGV